jgi:alanine dehydrogenase
VLVTILLTQADVAKLLTIEECIVAVEDAFRSYAEGKTAAPHVLGVHVDNGGFHIKAGASGKYFVAKSNANFPRNQKQFALPTIQGIIEVCDVVNGNLLALLDSIEITIIRTGAATAVAAKYLSPGDARVATICGCGNQGKISARAVSKVRPLEKIYAFDIDEEKVKSFCEEFGNEFEVIPTTAATLKSALGQSEICITCTPSRQPFIMAEDIMPGTFIAAVGADSQEKQELSTGILSSNKLVVDILEQSASIGELHHALKDGSMTRENVYAELGDIIRGIKPGRESREEIIVFDSTGTALQDIAAASIVYEKAQALNAGKKFEFFGR